jgi:hypothetical protein
MVLNGHAATWVLQLKEIVGAHVELPQIHHAEQEVWCHRTDALVSRGSTSRPERRPQEQDAGQLPLRCSLVTARSALALSASAGKRPENRD